jgi:two-component sensor histidine kinase/GAF domain-containing protein
VFSLERSPPFPGGSTIAPEPNKAEFSTTPRRARPVAGSGALQSGRETFLSGGGAVGDLMRRHDWSNSPLGQPETWPQSLRSVVGLLLNSKFPMFVAWGEELGFLYNDAYAEILGAKHPASLGARFHDIWSEIWADISPLIDAALAGQAIYREDLPLVMNRHGYDEETWFTFSYSPVRDETGDVAGMFCAVTETTSRVRGAQRQAFLFEADDALRDLDDDAEILSVSADLLGRHLAADRVHWAWIDDAAGAFQVSQEWTRPWARSLRGEHRLADFGEAEIAVMRRGGLMAATDLMGAEPAVRERIAAAFGPELRAALSVPLFRADHWKAALCVHSFQPRVWREDEQELIREFAERAWTRAGRARAEARVRLSEQRLRALVNATSYGTYRMSADWRELRRLDGRGFLADISSPSVAWVDEHLQPEDRAEVLAAVDEAIRTKGVFEIEHRVRKADGSLGWTLSRAVPLLDDRGDIVEWFGTATDVTERKKTEQHLRLMVNELNHRVKNSLATVQGIATQTLRRSDIPTDVREALTQRLLALATAHDVLTDERWRGADLTDLVEAAAAPYTGFDGVRPFVISGPRLYVPPRVAIALALALHELATNAAKYGALSVSGGQVHVTWSVADEPEGRRLQLAWREQGGPAVEPPAKTGFGTRLIQRALSGELGGKVDLLFDQQGLGCEMEAILAEDAADATWSLDPGGA